MATPSDPVKAVPLPSVTNPDPRLNVTRRPVAGFPVPSINFADALYPPPEAMAVVKVLPEYTPATMVPLAFNPPVEDMLVEPVMAVPEIMVEALTVVAPATDPVFGVIVTVA